MNAFSDYLGLTNSSVLTLAISEVKPEPVETKPRKKNQQMLFDP